jgi:putative membrane protein
MMHWGDYGWGMGFGWIWMIFFWGLVIAGIAYLVQAITRRDGKCRTEETPIDSLKKSFAKGDISKEQYEQVKNGLVHH